MDTILNVIIGFAITGGVTLLFSVIKGGKFESWGVVVGKALSKLGRARIGKAAWEKMEDVIIMSFVSFAKGLKDGADWDDENGNGGK